MKNRVKLIVIFVFMIILFLYSCRGFYHELNESSYFYLVRLLLNFMIIVGLIIYSLHRYACTSNPLVKAISIGAAISLAVMMYNINLYEAIFYNGHYYNFFKGDLYILFTLAYMEVFFQTLYFYCVPIILISLLIGLYFKYKGKNKIKNKI